MPQTDITLNVEVRDEREAQQVKDALNFLLKFNGVPGLLNLFDELNKSKLLLNSVKAIAEKFRRRT